METVLDSVIIGFLDFWHRSGHGVSVFNQKSLLWQGKVATPVQRSNEVNPQTLQHYKTQGKLGK